MPTENLRAAVDLLPDQTTRAAALAELRALSAAADPWAARARPTFLYVMYAILLWSVPLGLVAALRPAAADAVVRATTAYLAGIPEPLYALFGTGYLGYTAARAWGKARGVER
jgi:hypothetical protein